MAKAEIMGTCPYPGCKGIILRRGELQTDERTTFSYESLCPHCKRAITVRIGSRVEIVPKYA